MSPHPSLQAVAEVMMKSGITLAFPALGISALLYNFTEYHRLALWIFPLVPFGMSISVAGLIIAIWTL